MALDDGHDGALLNSRGALETVGVDFLGHQHEGIQGGGGARMPWEKCKLTATEQLRLKVHVVKGVDGLIVVGLDLSCR